MKKVPEHNAIIIRHDISILSRLDSTCHTQYIRVLTLFVLYQSSKCTGIIRLPDSTNTVKLHKKLKSHTRVTNDVYTSTAHKHTRPFEMRLRRYPRYQKDRKDFSGLILLSSARETSWDSFCKKRFTSTFLAIPNNLSVSHERLQIIYQKVARQLYHPIRLSKFVHQHCSNNLLSNSSNCHWAIFDWNKKKVTWCKNLHLTN